MSIKRIVAYGCSITAGMELADEQIVNLTEDQITKYKHKKGISYWLEYQQSHKGKEEVLKLENELSWVRWLADRLGVEYVNNAVYGGNNQLSIYLLESDLANNKINKSDLVIVGLTELTRWFWLNEKGDHKSGCVGGSDIRWPSSQFHKEFTLHVNNKYHMPYHWFNSIKQIELLSSKYNRQILQQFCINTYSDEKIRNHIGEELYPLTDQINSFESIIDKDFSFSSILDWDNKNHVHGFTHPRLEFHKAFADHIYKKL